MRYYVALVHKEADSDFGVSFPDFPGCISASATLTDAAAMGAEALGGHIDLMSEEGLAIPEPTSLEIIMEDPENRDGVPVMVPVTIRKPARAIRVNITMPEDVLARIDAFAESKGMNRSGFLAYAAKLQMEEAQRTFRNENFGMELETMFRTQKVGESIPLAASPDQHEEHHKKTAKRLFPLPDDRS